MVKEISDIQLLKKYIASKGKTQKIEPNNLTDFQSGDLVYAFTNECLCEYYEKNLRGKDVLAVTSSGDHILHAALAGAKNITGFDINRFCKYYSALKVAMIRKYDYEQFFEKINSFSYTSYIAFKEELPLILEDVGDFLMDDQKQFWYSFISCFKEGVPFFQNAMHRFADNAYFDETLYYQLKQNLEVCSIRYIDSAVDKLSCILDEKYDLIYLSNILSRIETYDKKQINVIVNSILQLLKADGTIYDYIIWFLDWHNNFEPNYYLDDIEGISLCYEELPSGRGMIYKYKKQSGDSNGN